MLVAGSQLIKLLRLRLQDIYKPEGALITNFLTENGISWLADELKGILTNAYIEYHRYRKLVYPSEYIIEERVSVGSGKISKSAFAFYPVNIIAIKNALPQGSTFSADDIYAFLDEKDYYAKLCNLSNVRQLQNMYTVIGNYIYIVSSSNVSEVDVIYEYQYDTAINFNGNIEVYSDLELILDLAELECRKILGTIEYVKLLSDMIIYKISLMMRSKLKDISLESVLGLSASSKSKETAK